MHESLDREHRIKSSSDRAFGFVLAAFFALIGAWPLMSGSSPRWWALAICAAFSLSASVHPPLLRPLNKIWTKFGLILHRVTNPLLMGIIFFLVVTPTGILMRLTGRDPLNRRFERSASTYWIPRTPPGPEPDTMKNQF